MFHAYHAAIVVIALQLPVLPSLLSQEPPQIDQPFRDLIPAASAIDRKVFERIAMSSSNPTADSFDENSLSAELLLLKTTKQEKGNDKIQFRYLTDNYPKPAEIANEMYHRVSLGPLQIVHRPVTMIHSERITRCEATVTGSRATGSFDFLVPDLYEGSADFKAQKVDDQWQIIEFEMKTVGIHIKRNEDGKWRRVD